MNVISDACNSQGQHVQQKYLVETKFNFVTRRQKELKSQTETMYSRETKISVTVLELNVIKIISMAT